MRIQFLNGGLANQVFQYVFSRYGELSGNGREKWFLDDSGFFVNSPYTTVYELERVFGIKPRLLSQAFEKDVWEEYVALKSRGYSIPQIFLEAGEDIAMYAEHDDYKTLNPFSGPVYRMLPEGGFYPSIPHINQSKVTYYHGSWIFKGWFNTYRDIFTKELVFPPITGKQALIYEEKINKTYSVAMHIRRETEHTLSTEYYWKTIRGLAEERQDFTVYVFSNDLFWCNQNASRLGLNFAPKVEFVSGNIGAGTYVDLYLMSKCDGIIMSGGAFAYLAALLSKNLDFFVEPDKSIYGNL